MGNVCTEPNCKGNQLTSLSEPNLFQCPKCKTVYRFVVVERGK